MEEQANWTKQRQQALNRGMKNVIAASSCIRSICTIRWYVTGHNQSKGEEQLGWAPIGCYDLPLTVTVFQNGTSACL